ncbi:UNVERIFIED_CONTAM: hypothetical protein Sindi_2735000 [Sesamum indicum]
MSQPNTSTTPATSASAVPGKRSSSPRSSTTPTATGVGAASVVPAMKKAKSQAVACSLDGNKNGQQQITPHVHFAEPPVHSPMMEDDPSDVAMEASPSSTAFGRRVSASGGGVTANLSRKKATPPQPTKKLVIKLVKGRDFSLCLCKFIMDLSDFDFRRKISGFLDEILKCFVLVELRREC